MCDSDIFKAALDKWGADSQILMMFEEMSELQKELCKHARGADNIDHIAEEIADVQIMLEQMIILHDCGESVDDYRAQKIERLESRICPQEKSDLDLWLSGQIDEPPF